MICAHNRNLTNEISFSSDNYLRYFVRCFWLLFCRLVTLKFLFSHQTDNFIDLLRRLRLLLLVVVDVDVVARSIFI